MQSALQASVVQNLLSGLLPASCLLPKPRQAYLPRKGRSQWGAVLADAGSWRRVAPVLLLAPVESQMLSHSRFMSVPLRDFGKFFGSMPRDQPVLETSNDGGCLPVLSAFDTNRVNPLLLCIMPFGPMGNAGSNCGCPELSRVARLAEPMGYLGEGRAPCGSGGHASTCS